MSRRHLAPGSSPSRRLGGWSEFAPPADLAAWVESVWTFRAPARDDVVGHRVLPHPALSLCFTHCAGAATDVGGELIVIGPVHTPRQFRPEPGRVMECVQVRPEWGRALLGVPPAQLIDAIVPVNAIGLSGGEALGERAAAAKTTDGAALPVLLDWVRTRVERGTPDRAARLAHTALRMLRATSARRRPVHRAAQATGTSERHLRRTVECAAGISPKRYVRMLRLNAVVAEADADTRPGWSRLAVRHGYADQAHLARETAALTGLPPVALHGERRREYAGGAPASSGAASEH